MKCSSGYICWKRYTWNKLTLCLELGSILDTSLCVSLSLLPPPNWKTESLLVPEFQIKGILSVYYLNYTWVILEMGHPEAKSFLAKKQRSYMLPGQELGHTQDRYFHSKREKLEKRKGAGCQAHINPQESARCSVTCLQSHHLGDWTSYFCEF